MIDMCIFNLQNKCLKQYCTFTSIRFRYQIP